MLMSNNELHRSINDFLMILGFNYLRDTIYYFNKMLISFSYIDSLFLPL